MARIFKTSFLFTSSSLRIPILGVVKGKDMDPNGLKIRNSKGPFDETL
jgi:hypothetical protein